MSDRMSERSERIMKRSVLVPQAGDERSEAIA